MILLLESDEASIHSRGWEFLPTHSRTLLRIYCSASVSILVGHLLWCAHGSNSHEHSGHLTSLSCKSSFSYTWPTLWLAVFSPWKRKSRTWGSWIKCSEGFLLSLRAECINWIEHIFSWWACLVEIMLGEAEVISSTFPQAHWFPHDVAANFQSLEVQGLRRTRERACPFKHDFITSSEELLYTVIIIAILKLA